MHGSRDLIRPGAFWAMYCLWDLYPILDGDDADEVREYWDEELMLGVWASFKEAVAALLPEQPPEERDAALKYARDNAAYLKP